MHTHMYTPVHTDTTRYRGGGLDRHTRMHARMRAHARDSHRFYLVTLEVEVVGAPCVAAIVRAQEAVSRADATSVLLLQVRTLLRPMTNEFSSLQHELAAIEKHTRAMARAIRRMHERCLPQVYLSTAPSCPSCLPTCLPDLPVCCQCGCICEHAFHPMCCMHYHRYSTSGSDRSSRAPRVARRCPMVSSSKATDPTKGHDFVSLVVRKCAHAPIRWIINRILLLAGSAAQSPLPQALDIGLNVSHNTTASTCEYLRGMRTYMQREHREFLEALEQGPSVRAFRVHRAVRMHIVCPWIHTCRCATSCTRIFRTSTLRRRTTCASMYAHAHASAHVLTFACTFVQAMAEFRSCHMALVSKYILQVGPTCSE